MCDEKERVDYDLGKKPIPKDVNCKWEKMSKSKGNIIDPLEIIEEYGTDAMRMALCSSATQAWEIDLDRRRFEEYKNFANKIWNGARFIFMNLDKEDPLTNEQFAEGIDQTLLQLEDQWILSSLAQTIDQVNQHLGAYQFDQAATLAYEFYWNAFCSYYLEIAKPVLFGKPGTAKQRKNKQKLLLTILLQAIRLIHPMAPFITEELFQLLKERFNNLTTTGSTDPLTQEAITALSAKACIVAPYPQPIEKQWINESVAQAFSLIAQVVYTIRNIRGEMNIPPKTETEVHIVGMENSVQYPLVKQNRAIIEALVKTQSIKFHNNDPQFDFASFGIVENLKVIIPMPKELVQQEAIRLEKEKERLEKQQVKIKNQLDNENFVSKAPKELIDKTKSQLEQIEKELVEVTAKLAKIAKK